MKTMLSLMMLVGCLLFSNPVHAVHSCTVTSAGAGAAYDPLATGTKTAQSSVTLNCMRAAGDAAQLNYTLMANNGANASGQANRARLGTQTVSYDLFRDSVCSAQWRPTGNNYFSGTLDFGGALSISIALDYWACIPGGQTGLAAGSYIDTVTMTLIYGNAKATEQTAANTFPVTINTSAQCVISTAPGTVDFGTYVAFGAAAAASTTFGVTCTNSLPFTLAVTPAVGVLTGLNYTVSSPASATGTGVQQLLTINGAMPGGQAGQCASSTCTGSNIHTLTVTY